MAKMKHIAMPLHQLENAAAVLSTVTNGHRTAESLQKLALAHNLIPRHKGNRLASGIEQLDLMLGGGIMRGQISEFIGALGSGKTSLAARFAASATRQGELVGWIDPVNAFDPSSVLEAGADLARVLWIATSNSVRHGDNDAGSTSSRYRGLLKAAEMALDAGIFGLVVIDFTLLGHPIQSAAALRLARIVERSTGAVIGIGTTRICGAFAGLSLTMRRKDALFTRSAPQAPILFDGMRIEIEITRSRHSRTGVTTVIDATLDPSSRHLNIAPRRPRGSGGENSAITAIDGR
jgi:hypothetical protein